MFKPSRELAYFQCKCRKFCFIHETTQVKIKPAHIVEDDGIEPLWFEIWKMHQDGSLPDVVVISETEDFQFWIKMYE